MDKHETTHGHEPNAALGANPAADARFERELQQAMRRVDTPASLEVSLLNLAEAEHRRAHSLAPSTSRGRILSFPRQRAWFGGAIAAMLILGCLSFAGLHTEHVREQARARQATQQFQEAQQITDRTMMQIRLQIAQASSPLNGPE